MTTQSVTVRGLAPPNAVVTQDVSLGLDQHAIADLAGTWSMDIALAPGTNTLRFRLGDDRTTEETVTVEYQP